MGSFYCAYATHFSRLLFHEGIFESPEFVNFVILYFVSFVNLN